MTTSESPVAFLAQFSIIAITFPGSPEPHPPQESNYEANSTAFSGVHSTPQKPTASALRLINQPQGTLWVASVRFARNDPTTTSRDKIFQHSISLLVTHSDTINQQILYICILS